MGYVIIITLILLAFVIISAIAAFIIAGVKTFVTGRSFRKSFTHLFLEIFFQLINPFEWFNKF